MRRNGACKSWAVIDVKSSSSWFEARSFVTVVCNSRCTRSRSSISLFSAELTRSSSAGDFRVRALGTRKMSELAVMTEMMAVALVIGRVHPRAAGARFAADLGDAIGDVGG